MRRASKQLLPNLLGRRIDIYLNLHKPGYLSVRSASGPDRGRVIAHVQGIDLKDVVFKVSETGRDRVRRNRRKEVHAVVRGTITQCLTEAQSCLITNYLADHGGIPVRYNPYETDFFITRKGGKRVNVADRIVANGGWLVAMSPRSA